MRPGHDGRTKGTSSAPGHAFFGALPRPRSSAPLARCSARSRHRRPKADTRHFASLHMPPDDTHNKAPKHAIMPSPPQILPQICPSTPLRRWSGASRAQSMHTGTCLTLARAAGSHPALNGSLAAFSEPRPDTVPTPSPQNRSSSSAATLPALQLIRKPLNPG